jgi:hypothetical protein
MEGSPMTQMMEENEALVMQHLERAHPVILDRVVENKTVDTLSRKGVISVRRRGFNYELSLIS